MTRRLSVATLLALMTAWSAGVAGPALAGVTTVPDEGDILARIDPAKDYFPVLRAQLAPAQTLYFTGRPMLVDFLIVNTSDEPAMLRVPYETAPVRVSERHLGGGLPLDHVFSRRTRIEGLQGHRALVISPMGDPITELDDDVTYATTQPAEPIVIRPHGVIGRRVDLTTLYPSLTRPGRFNVQWRPYSDALRSPPVEIRVMTEERAILETRLGNMEIHFLYDRAPDHVENFLDLARNGFYTGTLFHRVIDGFMIQGGDPLTTDKTQEAMWGRGRGPRTLRQEFNDTPFAPGTVGAARGPDVNSASCQFFVVTGQAGHLNGQYTAFGRLANAESLKVAEKIAQVRVNASDQPVEEVRIDRVRVEPIRGGGATTRPASQPDTRPGGD